MVISVVKQQRSFNITAPFDNGVNILLLWELISPMSFKLFLILEINGFEKIFIHTRVFYEYIKNENEYVNVFK